MGYMQNMTPEQRRRWGVKKYRRNLDAKRGSNYEYWNAEKHGKLLENGYQIYRFTSDQDSTGSESLAKEVVAKLRSEGNFARIICGYEQNQQKEKRYSIIYRPKAKQP